MPLAVIAKLTAQTGKRDELVDLLQKLVAASHDEPGTLVYSMHAALNNDEDVYFYELYADKEASKAHATGPVMQEVGPQILALLAGPPEITRLEVRGAKGLPVST